MTPLQSRTVALSLFLLLIASTLWGTVGQAWLTYRDQAEAIEADRVEHGRLLASLLRLRREVAETDLPTEDRQSLFLQAKNAPAAAAQVQSLVGERAKSFGIGLESAQTLPSAAKDGYVEIAINLRLKGPQGNMLRMIQSLEAQVPYLIIRNATIDADRSAGIKHDLLTGNFEIVAALLEAKNE